MLVTCSACSAKFQLPDDKIRGRKARMKCKTCGASIAIDGTSLGANTSHAAPPPPSRRGPPPRVHEQEVLTFNDQTVALGPGEAEALSRQSREGELSVAPDLEDRITPVSNPRAAPSSLLDDNYVDAAMDALEQKVFSVPAPHPGDAKTAQPKPPTVDDDEATRMMDLPRLLSGGPAAPSPPALKSSAPDGEVEEATRMMDLAGPAGLLGSAAPRRADKDGEEATRIFDAEPVPRAPRLPPRPSLPRAPTASPAAPTAPASAAAELPPPVVLSDPAQGSAGANPLEISTAKVDVRALAVPGVPGPVPNAPELPPAPGAPPVLPMGEALSSPPAAPERRPGRPAADVTAQRARIPSSPPPPSPSNWGVYLFFAALAAIGLLAGLYVFSRPTFDRAISSTRQALGLAGESEGDGPAFNAALATTELERVAARAPSCKTAGGPTGAGRARVLFQMNGSASSAAVSQPFHGSSSEACLLGLFKSAKVPAFGGKPAIVTKTFRID